LLAGVAQRLQTVTTPPDEFVARLGGDEFALLVTNCDDLFRVDRLAAAITKSLKLPFEISGQSVYIGASIGIAMTPAKSVGADALLSRADFALYSAKNSGGGTRTFFMPSMQNRSEQRLRLSNELREAFLARDSSCGSSRNCRCPTIGCWEWRRCCAGGILSTGCLRPTLSRTCCRKAPSPKRWASGSSTKPALRRRGGGASCWAPSAWA
jgi:GGDEF domain-containing protein